jgi:hypothetical protein
MKRLSCLVAAALLQACAVSTPPPPIVTVQKVPVVQPWPQPPEVHRPQLYIDKQDENNLKYDQLNKALQITVAQLKSYAQTLETYLNVYRTQQTFSLPVSTIVNTNTTNTTVALTAVPASAAQ